MTNSSVSSIEELNAAIQSYNPFSSVAIDNVQSVWGKGFPDLPTLNAHASQKVLEVIKQVKTSPESKDKVATLVVTADIGSGKTQLIGRLRRRVIGDGSALFIFANAAKYGDLDLLRYQFLQTLVENLARVGSQGVTQWQEVAAALANASNPTGQKTPATTLVKNFDRAYAKALQNNHNLIKKLSVQILKSKPDADPYILRAILWTLSEMYAPYAVEWLAGNELDQETADSMGLPTNASKTAQDHEAEALGNLQQILRLVTDHKPVLICFDELEGSGLSSYGFTKAQVIARLVKDLYDNLEQSGIGKGVVILTVMFGSTWAGQINTTAVGGVADMGGGVVDRLSTATQGNPIDLKPLDSQSTVDLVALWLREHFYEPRELQPHEPTYPFKEDELRKVGKGKPTVREALDWCAKNWGITDPTPPPDPTESFRLACEEVKKADIGDYLEDKALIADALRFGFENLTGETLEGKTSTGENLKQVTIEKVDTEVKAIDSKISPRGLSNDNWINLKVSGSDNNKKFTIGVAVIQKKGAAALGAGLRRLTAYERFGLTRGCLVRSKDKKIAKNTDAYKSLQLLTATMGGEQVDLKAEEIQPLINVNYIYKNCDRYNLSKEQVLEFAKPLILDNPLLREILSDPSGAIDEETIQEEELFGALFEESSTDNTADENELNDLFAAAE